MVAQGVVFDVAPFSALDEGGSLEIIGDVAAPSGANGLEKLGTSLVESGVATGRNLTTAMRDAGAIERSSG